jgi:mRNA interferase MazF
VILTPEDGMPATCALNFDHVALAQRGHIGALVCTLPEARWPAVRRALLIACGFERESK